MRYNSDESKQNSVIKRLRGLDVPNLLGILSHNSFKKSKNIKERTEEKK